MSALVEVKTAELEGKALAWAVARANGDIAEGETLDRVNEVTPMWWMDYEPQEDWSQGGPLIEKHGVSIILDGDAWWAGFQAVTQSMFGMGFDGAQAAGTTPLVAACRAIVAAKLGDTVSVPAELVGGGV